MKKSFLLIAAFGTLLSGCITGGDYNESAARTAKNNMNNLEAGKSMAIAIIDECPSGIMTISRKTEAGFEDIPQLNISLPPAQGKLIPGDWHLVTTPGEYYVSGIYCRNYSAGRRPALIPQGYSDTELVKIPLANPRFELKAGEVRHIGRISLERLEEREEIHGTRVVYRVIPLTEAEKNEVKEAYAQFGDRLTFSPAEIMIERVLGPNYPRRPAQTSGR